MPEPITHRETWDLEHVNDRKAYPVPAGWPGAAAYLVARKVSGTASTALKVQRRTPLGLEDLPTAVTLDLSSSDTDSAQLTADVLQGVAELAVVNPASQSAVVELHITIEPLPDAQR